MENKQQEFLQECFKQEELDRLKEERPLDNQAYEFIKAFLKQSGESGFILGELTDQIDKIKLANNEKVFKGTSNTHNDLNANFDFMIKINEREKTAIVRIDNATINASLMSWLNCIYSEFDRCYFIHLGGDLWLLVFYQVKDKIGGVCMRLTEFPIMAYEEIRRDT